MAISGATGSRCSESVFFKRHTGLEYRTRGTQNDCKCSTGKAWTRTDFSKPRAPFDFATRERHCPLLASRSPRSIAMGRGLIPFSPDTILNPCE